MDSFLMIGQSNMAGRGDLGDVKEINNPRCFMLRCGRWVTMSDPVNPDRGICGEFASGVSLASSFADAYANAGGCDTGLIPCAYGGTGISEWQPGELLFDHALMMAKLAQRTSEMKGILWHQGENDCISEELYNTYPEKFLRTMKALRREFPDIPVIIGEISWDIDCDRWNVTKERIQKFNKRLPILAENLGNCKVVSSKGLTLRNDGIHFDSKSQRIFGKRYFEMYMSLENRSCFI